MAWSIEGVDPPHRLRWTVAAVCALWFVVGQALSPPADPPLRELQSYPPLVAYAAAHPEVRRPAACQRLLSAPPKIDRPAAPGDPAEFERRCHALWREVAQRGSHRLTLTPVLGTVQPGVVAACLPSRGLFGGALAAIAAATALPWLLALWGGGATVFTLLGSVVGIGVLLVEVADAPYYGFYGPALVAWPVTAAFAMRMRRVRIDIGVALVPGWLPAPVFGMLALLGVGLTGTWTERAIALAVGGVLGLAVAHRLELAEEGEEASLRRDLGHAAAALRKEERATAAAAASATDPVPSLAKEADGAAAGDAAGVADVAPEPRTTAEDDALFAALVGEAAPAAAAPDEAAVVDVAVAGVAAAVEPPSAPTPTAEEADAMAKPDDPAIVSLLDAVLAQDPRAAPTSTEPGGTLERTRAVRPKPATVPADAMTRVVRKGAGERVEADEPVGEPTRAWRQGGAVDGAASHTPPDDLPDAAPTASGSTTSEPTAPLVVGEPPTRALDPEEVRGVQIRSAVAPTVAFDASTAAYSDDQLAAARAAIARAKDPRRAHEAETEVLGEVARSRQVRLRERGHEGFLMLDQDGLELLLTRRQVVGVVAGKVPAAAVGLTEGDAVMADLYVRRDTGIERWRLSTAGVHFARVTPGLRPRDGWSLLLRELSEGGAPRLPATADWPGWPPAPFPSLDAFEAAGTQLLRGRTH